VHVTTGVIPPARAPASMARERGIACDIDGAPPPGMMEIDIHALGADFDASSPHKWLLAPQGTGFLWMREEWRTKLWPTLASGGWDDTSLGAQRFNHLGTLDESRLAGLDAALRFQQALGIDRIAARVRQLRHRLRAGLAANPRVRIVSPEDDTLCAGMVSFQLEGVPSLELQRRLAQKANVRTRVIGEYDYGWMRLSPHIYNTVEEIDRVVGLIAEEKG
jgi:L-cysteine/cystine lyase